jgi:membrane associated rhomboid family serine protease
MQALTVLVTIAAALVLLSMVVGVLLKWGNTLDKKSDAVVTGRRPIELEGSELVRQKYETEENRPRLSLLDQLTKLGELHSNGYLSADEFRAIKAMVLNSETTSDIRYLDKQPLEVEDKKVLKSRELSPREHLFGEGATTVVFLLVAINASVFVLMLLQNPSPKFDTAFLLSWGADYGKLTLHGQPWRLITSTFVHLNLAHIAGNMSALLYWGRVTEQALGSRMFLLVYLLCGVSASVTSVTVNPQIVSAGASGAIAGVLGIMCVMLFKGDSRVSVREVLGNLAFNVALSFLAGVDWVTHVGGLASGLFFGALFL